MSVGDRATGLTLDEMKQRLGHLGVRASGHERGENKRGNRGRGIRDAASLGLVLFESIKDGLYAYLQVDRNGAIQHSPRNTRATAEERERLGIPRNGLVAHIYCRKARRIHKPQMDRLKAKLERHVQLRGIMTDPSRTVTLEYPEKGKSSRLRYTPPAGARVVEATQLEVPGYPAMATVSLSEVQDPIQEEFDMYRQSGLLMRSGRSVHESTLFRFDNNPWAGCFLGEVRWDTIDDLIREFEDRDDSGITLDAGNDRAIVRLDRSGLDRQHPAIKALKEAVEGFLTPHFARREKLAGHGRVEDETQRRLNRMGKTITKFILRKQAEYEIEPILGQGESGIPPTLAVIPGSIYLEFGEKRVFTVRALRDALPQGVNIASAKLEVVADPENCGQLAVDGLELTPDAKRVEFLSGNFDVTAGAVAGELYIVVVLKEFGLDAEARVHIEEPTEEPPPAPPLTFDFGQKQYSVGDGKKRRLKLLAPVSAVQKHGVTVRLANSNPAAVLVRQTGCELAPAAEGAWYEAEIEAEGRQHGGETTLTATLGPIPAVTQVRVGRDKKGINVRLDALKAPVPGTWEEDATDGNVTVTINAAHPAHERYFGPAPAFQYQRSVPAQLLVAEVLAWLTVRQVLQGVYRNSPIDIGRQYLEQNKLLHELRPLLHRDAVSDEEVRRVQDVALHVAHGLVSPAATAAGRGRANGAEDTAAD
jgi:hypothetical protein